MKCIGQQQLSHQKVICWYLNFTSSTIVLGPSPCFTLQAPVNEKLMETTNYHSRLLDNPMLNHSSKTEDKSPLTMPALSTLICLQLYHTAFTSIATGKERTASDVAPMYHKPQNGLWTPVKVVSWLSELHYNMEVPGEKTTTAHILVALRSTTSVLTTTVLIYATRAGITAGAGTRLFL